MWKAIEKRFKEATRFWLAKPGNFDKHVDFLKNRILGRFTDAYDLAEVEVALDIFKSDPDAGVDRIFDALKVALERKFQFEMQKGQRLLSAHNSGSAGMQDLGNGQIKVPSENDSSKTYSVDLTRLTCECRSAKRLSYAGLLCKHTMAAVEAFKHKYPVGLELWFRVCRYADRYRAASDERLRSYSEKGVYLRVGSGIIQGRDTQNAVGERDFELLEYLPKLRRCFIL